MNNVYPKFDLNQFDQIIETFIKKKEIGLEQKKILGLFNSSNFNNLAKEYFKEKFIYNREKESEKILFEIFKNFEVTQIICQNLWGYNSIKKNNITHLFEFFNIQLDDRTLSSFLMILNKLNFIAYNKKSGIIKIQYNSFEENKHDFKLPEITLLNPDKPYTNRIILRKYIREANNHIYWFDKYLDKNIFEILFLEVDSNNIKSIKLLTTKSQHINAEFIKDYFLLKKELKNKSITLECNIIDSNISRQIHDRWFITKDKKFNFPSFQSFFKGQFAEIKETKNEINFNSWWINSNELN